MIDPKEHLGLVAFVTKRVAAYSKEPFDDIFQEGCLGLIRAAEKFDPSRGISFSTYAHYWIFAYAHDLGVKERSRRFLSDPEYIDNLPDRSVMDREEEIDAADRLALMWKAVAKLSPKERELIQMKYVDGLQIVEIGKRLGVSRASVHNYANKIIAKLRKTLTRTVP